MRKKNTQTFGLVGGQQLVLERNSCRSVLKLISRNGEIHLSVYTTAEGHVLQFDGTHLIIQASGTLAIAADNVAIHGRNGIAITSGADAHIRVARDLHTEARVQNIAATLGNVNVKANDDVKLNGERVLMNCD
jgi:hypothetical protein